MSSYDLYQGLLKRGHTKETAFFNLLDTYNDQHWSDRNRYADLLKKQQAEIAELKSRLFRLETKGQGE